MSPTSLGGGFRFGFQAVSISMVTFGDLCIVETPLRKVNFPTTEKFTFEPRRYEEAQRPLHF